MQFKVRSSENYRKRRGISEGTGLIVQHSFENPESLFLHLSHCRFCPHRFESVACYEIESRPREVLTLSAFCQLSQVLLEDVFPVQEDDSLMSSHPVVVTVSTPAEITSVFDGISYSKVGDTQHWFGTSFG